MGAAAKVATNRKNSIGDFFVDKVDDDVMHAFLKTNKIPKESVDPSLEGEKLGVALSLYFRETTKNHDKNMCKCARCGGEGPIKFPNCAFCGLEGEPMEEEEEDDASDGDETNTEELAAKVSAEETAAAPKKTSAKKNAAASKNAPAKPTALATTTPSNVEVIFKVQDLDDAVEKVIKLKSMAAVSFWALGRELLAINERQLWKLRTTGKGKAKYTSFNQFLEEEVKISDTHAYNLMGIAEKFGEEDVFKFGKAKLAIMIKAPDEILEEVKARAEGTTTRALKEEVAKANEERGGKGKTKQSAAGKKGAKAKAAKSAAKKADDKITIASIEGTKRIKLFAKPTSIRNIDWSTLKRAKTIDAQPFGKLELTNEVTMIITFVKTESGLEAVIKTQRDTSEE